MSIASFALAQLAIAQAAAKASTTKTPPKRTLEVQSDPTAVPEPR